MRSWNVSHRSATPSTASTEPTSQGDRLQKAADEVRSALAELLASDTVSAEWAAQAVRTLEETEFAVPVVNIDTRKEPGL